MSLPTKEEWEALGFLVHPDLCSQPIDHVRDFLDGNITTGKLLQLVPSPRDLVGCFSNIIDELKGKA